MQAVQTQNRLLIKGSLIRVSTVSHSIKYLKKQLHNI